MVLRARSAGLVPALVVPDEQTWTMSGSDPVERGLEPVFSAVGVRRVLVAESLPELLAEPLARYVEDVPPSVPRPTLPLTHGGHGEHDRHEHHGGGQEDHDGHEHHGGHGGHDAHAGHGGHDHGDMMAIVGEPSADGLVMEPLEFRFGPIGTPLPGGLVAHVRLDGDVVESCELTALLSAGAAASVPDALAPHTWQAAIEAAHEAQAGLTVPPSERWGRIAHVEIERALSHTAWLRSFARLLGWVSLVERTNRAVAAALEAQRLGGPALEDARAALGELASYIDRSRLFRWRTAGRAVMTSERARELGLRGPVARASGLAEDARLDDPLYRRLGFEAVVRSEGDALARALVRVYESVGSIELARRALEAAASEDLAAALPTPAPQAVIEGPRGPVQVHLDGSHREVGAPGADAALAAAGEAVVGAEWSAAVIGLASFDLSPWRVAG